MTTSSTNSPPTSPPTGAGQASAEQAGSGLAPQAHQPRAPGTHDTPRERRRRGEHGSSEPHEIDRLVGARIRRRRVELGQTQKQLGDAIGFSAQQVHKYEHGTSAVGCSTLWQIAEALEVSEIGYFFASARRDDRAPAARRAARLAPHLDALPADTFDGLAGLVTACAAASSPREAASSASSPAPEAGR